MKPTETDLLLPPAKLLHFSAYLDERGYSMQLLDTKIFRSFGFKKIRMVESYNEKKHTLRGMHFQPPPYQEQRLVRVLQGRIQACIVDINKMSPNFGNYEMIFLEESDFEYLFVPINFLHGYVTLENHTVIQYFFDIDYHPEIRTGIKWSDPDLAIPWIVQPKVVGRVDQDFPSFREMFLLD